MKLKNTSGKIVSVGDTVILPGETSGEIPGFDGNPVIAAMVKRKDLAIVKEPAARKGK